MGSPEVGKKRIRVQSILSGDQLCEVEVSPRWDGARLKCEVETLTGVPKTRQRLLHGVTEIADDARVLNHLVDDAKEAPCCGEATSSLSELSTIGLLKVDWVTSLSSIFHEIQNVSSAFDLSSRKANTSRLLGGEWKKSCECPQLESVEGTPDYIVAVKIEIAETWKSTSAWGQIVLFTACGFPRYVKYPCRCPDLVLESQGEPRLLAIVSNHDDDNQHLSRCGLSCTDYDLPTGVEISIVLVVAGDSGAVFIDGEEVVREQVGNRESHSCL